MTDVPNVKCGRCEVPLERPIDSDHKVLFTCPNCGESDTRENVLREVHEYVQEQAAKDLEKTMAGIAKGSAILQFTPSRRPQRRYRFIVDLESH